VEVCCSLFGDTVNTAARMEGSSETMRIHLSYESYRLLQVRSWTMEGGGGGEWVLAFANGRGWGV
jgi:class 3 adenylate cyclase